jgi:hypothetical protein
MEKSRQPDHKKELIKREPSFSVNKEVSEGKDFNPQ